MDGTPGQSGAKGSKGKSGVDGISGKNGKDAKPINKEEIRKMIEEIVNDVIDKRLPPAFDNYRDSIPTQPPVPLTSPKVFTSCKSYLLTSYRILDYIQRRASWTKRSSRLSWKSRPTGR